MLITVQNNRWGISTSYDGQHGEKNIADRGKAFGIRTAVINGNDPVESYIRLKEEMDYIRKTGKPVLLEASVSRLYGHSSASGANFVSEEEDCLPVFESKLLKEGVLKERDSKKIRQGYEKESQKFLQIARGERGPEAETVWDHYYANNENGNWRSF
jgi:2-oxoisovalerate dehydrogenase E1 component alpha subunit